MTLRNMRLSNAKLHSCRCGSPSEPRSPWLGVFEVPTPSDCSVFPRAMNWFSNLQRERSCDTLSETQEDKPSNIWLSGTLCHGRTKLKRLHKQRCVLQNANVDREVPPWYLMPGRCQSSPPTSRYLVSQLVLRTQGYVYHVQMSYPNIVHVLIIN